MNSTLGSLSSSKQETGRLDFKKPGETNDLKVFFKSFRLDVIKV